MFFDVGSKLLVLAFLYKKFEIVGMSVHQWANTNREKQLVYFKDGTGKSVATNTFCLVGTLLGRLWSDCLVDVCRRLAF